MTLNILANYYWINFLSIHINIFKIFSGQFNSIPRKCCVSNDSDSLSYAIKVSWAEHQLQMRLFPSCCFGAAHPTSPPFSLHISTFKTLSLQTKSFPFTQKMLSNDVALSTLTRQAPTALLQPDCGAECGRLEMAPNAHCAVSVSCGYQLLLLVHSNCPLWMRTHTNP